MPLLNNRHFLKFSLGFGRYYLLVAHPWIKKLSQPYRFCHCGARLAFLRPYFLRSLILESRVKSF